MIKELVSVSERLSHARKVVGITKKDFLSWRRFNVLTTKRGLVYCYLRDVYNMSYPEIAALSNRDHTSIIYSINKNKDLYATIKHKFKEDLNA